MKVVGSQFEIQSTLNKLQNNMKLCFSSLMCQYLVPPQVWDQWGISHAHWDTQIHTGWTVFTHHKAGIYTTTTWETWTFNLLLSMRLKAWTRKWALVVLKSLMKTLSSSPEKSHHELLVVFSQKLVVSRLVQRRWSFRPDEAHVLVQFPVRRRIWTSQRQNVFICPTSMKE